jgi:hypothetical protein
MRDLRTPEEREQGIELSADERVKRLADHVVTLEWTITQMNFENHLIVRDLQDKVAEIEPQARFYSMMTQQIVENPTLMNEWQNFCLLLKMTDPNENKYHSA